MVGAAVADLPLQLAESVLLGLGAAGEEQVARRMPALEAEPVIVDRLGISLLGSELPGTRLSPGVVAPKRQYQGHDAKRSTHHLPPQLLAAQAPQASLVSLGGRVVRITAGQAIEAALQQFQVVGCLLPDMFQAGQVLGLEALGQPGQRTFQSHRSGLERWWRAGGVSPRSG